MTNMCQICKQIEINYTIEDKSKPLMWQCLDNEKYTTNHLGIGMVILAAIPMFENKDSAWNEAGRYYEQIVDVMEYVHPSQFVKYLKHHWEILEDERPEIEGLKQKLTEYEKVVEEEKIPEPRFKVNFHYSKENESIQEVSKKSSLWNEIKLYFVEKLMHWKLKRTMKKFENTLNRDKNPEELIEKLKEKLKF